MRTFYMQVGGQNVRVHPVTVDNAFKTDGTHKQRMTTQQWKYVLLCNADTVEVHVGAGNTAQVKTYQLKAKSLGAGVMEVTAYDPVS